MSGRIIIRKFLTKSNVLLFLTLISIILYNEVYLFQSVKWNTLECEDNKQCTKILLVADPQLIGYQKEVLHFLTPIAIWDSDRYLRKTYEIAFDYVKPDVIIFLGDLFDEGSICTSDEFRLYARRLFDIFLYDPTYNARHIWLPGDNDIGGEGFEFVKASTIKRFETTFLQDDTIHVKNITFYKINRLIKSIPKIAKVNDFFDTNQLTVGLSHIPLLFIPAPFVEKVLKKVQPHVIFVAHEHKSMVVSMDAVVQLERHIDPLTPSLNHQVRRYTLGLDKIYEVIVPTCSYRMGTDKVGYGFAIIERDELQYTVLWSPSRFSQLIIYGVIAVSYNLYLLYCLFARTRRSLVNRATLNKI